MLAQAIRCRVCGWRGEDEVCPRCGTVLQRGRAQCQTCGKVFDGILAQCDACGGTIEAPDEPEEPKVIRRLAQLPGVDDRMARALYARGFREPAEVLKLALPDRAVRLGLHRTLARKVALGELQPIRRVRKAIPCPNCGVPKTDPEDACPGCGTYGVVEPSTEEIEQQIDEVAGLVYDLAKDPDFREMPVKMREEILDAFEGAGMSTVVDNEYALQLREWKARGFDTRELEYILREEGPEAFREKCVPIIRSQLLKKRNGVRFRCPLCEVPIPPAAPECENCGAKFSVKA